MTLGSDHSCCQPRRRHLTADVVNCYANFIDIGYINPRLRYNYFRFGKTTVRHTEFYIRFRFDHITVLGMSLCIRLPNFVQISPSSAEIIMMLYRFLRWRPLRRAGAILFTVSDQVNVRFYQQTKYRSYNSIRD